LEFGHGTNQADDEISKGRVGEETIDSPGNT